MDDRTMTSNPKNVRNQTGIMFDNKWELAINKDLCLQTFKNYANESLRKRILSKLFTSTKTITKSPDRFPREQNREQHGHTGTITHKTPTSKATTLALKSHKKPKITKPRPSDSQLWHICIRDHRLFQMSQNPKIPIPLGFLWAFNLFCRLFCLLLGQEHLVNVGNYASVSYSNFPQKLPQFIVISHSQLNMAGNYPILLVVSGSISCQFKHLSC